MKVGLLPSKSLSVEDSANLNILISGVSFHSSMRQLDFSQLSISGHLHAGETSEGYTYELLRKGVRDFEKIGF